VGVWMNMAQISIGGRGRAAGLTCLFTHRAASWVCRYECGDAEGEVRRREIHVEASTLRLEGLHEHTLNRHERLDIGDKTNFRPFRHTAMMDKTMFLMFSTTPLGLGLRCRCQWWS
jgi:hypothetical protein